MSVFNWIVSKDEQERKGMNKEYGGVFKKERRKFGGSEVTFLF